MSSFIPIYWGDEKQDSDRSFLEVSPSPRYEGRAKVRFGFSGRCSRRLPPVGDDSADVFVSFKGSLNSIRLWRKSKSRGISTSTRSLGGVHLRWQFWGRLNHGNEKTPRIFTGHSNLGVGLMSARFQRRLDGPGHGGRKLILVD